MHNDQPPGIPAGAGRRKAARIIAAARHGAKLGQTELARRSGIQVRTLTRIERGEVIPRIDTLERVLLSCGLTLTVEPRLETRIDRDAIRRLLSLAPAARLSALPSSVSLRRVLQGLCYVRLAGVRAVVVGGLAARLHGAPEDIRGIEIAVPGTEQQRARILRLARRLDRRFARVPLFTEEMDPLDHQELLRASRSALVFGAGFIATSLDDLIARETTLSRKETLFAVREEADAG